VSDFAMSADQRNRRSDSQARRNTERNKLIADPSTGTHSQSAARHSLADFLRTMRDRAQPRSNGGRARRRVPGLRREEVAAEAGISLAWYTWLEQGRPVRVSRRTLASIADALRLDATERAHLFHLADAADAPPARPSLTGCLPNPLRALVDALGPHPAYAVNGMWHVVHANLTATRVFGDFGAHPGVTDNVLARLFLDPHWRVLFEDWERVAELAAAQFRSATAPLVGDAEVQALVNRLRDRSATFAACWGQELSPPLTWRKAILHPTAGRLSMHYSSFAPDDGPADVRVILYVPADPSTAARLGELSRPARTLTTWFPSTA
jgi:transcriptional regulator with XRE-family HTH domain